MAVEIELGALLVALFLLYLLIRFLKNPLYILINSALAVLIFVILNLFGLGISINLISVGVVAIGGFAGLLLVLLLHFLGIAF